MVLDTTLEAADDSDPLVADDLDLEGHGPALVMSLFLSPRDGVRITELAGAIKDVDGADLERSIEVRSAQIGFPEVRSIERRPDEFGPREVSFREIRSTQIRFPEVRPAERSLAEGGLKEVGFGEINSAQVRFPEVRPAEIRSTLSDALLSTYSRHVDLS